MFKLKIQKNLKEFIDYSQLTDDVYQDFGRL